MSTLAEKLRPTHFIDGLVGVLHDVELVIDDATAGSPLFDAQPVGFPHIHARRCNPLPLASTQLALKEFIQGFFLPFPAEPYWLAAFQIAHHGDELLLFPQVDFIYA